MILKLTHSFFQLGREFYGDDLYFFMFKAKLVGGKKNDRRALLKRDEEGVEVIQSKWNFCNCRLTIVCRFKVGFFG